MSGQIIPLSEVTISTSLAADNVSNAFSLTGTLLGPQPLSVIFDMGWDGGDVTITGTAVNPRTLEVEAWFEVVSSAPGDTVETERAFAVVTAASKSALGATANTAQIKALWPTRAPIEPAAVTQPLSTGGFVPMQGNVYGAQQIKANMVVLKAAVANGEVELTPIFWQDGRWWPHPGGKLSVDDTMLNKSAVGRYVTVADPSTWHHVWLKPIADGEIDTAYLRGKMGPVML